MKIKILIVLFCLFGLAKAKASDTFPLDTFSFNNIKINNIPAAGHVSDLLNFIEPDSITYSTHDCPTIYDNDNEHFHLLFDIYCKTVYFTSNGECYYFESMEIIENTISFLHNGDTHIFTEYTTVNDVMQVFKNAGTWVNKSDEIWAIEIFNADNLEFRLRFSFENNMLASITYHHFLC